MTMGPFYPCPPNAKRPRQHQSPDFSLLQPPARLFAMICLNMAERVRALIFSPRRMATVWVRRLLSGIDKARSAP